MNLTDPEKLSIFLGAFRYYLGRSTYAVSDFTELLARHWDELDPHTKNLITKELKKALEEDDASRDPSESGPYSHGRLGHDIDRYSWQTLYNTINK